MNALLLSNGNLIDGTGAPGRNASLFIEDGKVAALGAEADARADHQRAVDRIDVKGMSVMPGLIDTHCHLSFDDAESNPEIFFQRRNALSALVASYNAKKLLRAGVTSVLDPDSIYENSIDLRDAIDAGVVDGPRMSCGAYALITGVGGTAGRLIADDGVTGYYKTVHDKDEIVKEIRRQIKVGADWIKVHVTGLIPRQLHRGEVCVWTDEELKTICDAAHDLGVPVMGHCRGADATYKAAKAGFDLLFHATGMDERALEAVIERKIPISPAFTFQANMVDFGSKIGTSEALTKIFEREITESVDTLKRAYEAGVPLMCGSESGFSLVPYGEWHYREMEVFVRYLGLTPLQAIGCATNAGAVAMQKEGKIGALKPGYFADLVCVEGDPSKDVTILGETDRIKYVMVGGRFKDLSPLPARQPIGGWKLPYMGSQLTREVAFSNRSPTKVFNAEELH